MKKVHKLHPATTGLATLLVDYLSLWGEEMELLSLLLATLIAGIVLELQGFFTSVLVSALYSIVVAMEIFFLFNIARERRFIEVQLWRVVNEMDNDNTSNTNSTGSNK